MRLQSAKRVSSLLIFSVLAPFLALRPGLAQDAAPANVKPIPYLEALKTAGNVPLLLLNTEAKVWSLHVTSGAKLTVSKGNLMVNSSHSHALWAAGESTIQVPNGAIGVVGGVNRMGNPSVAPEPQTNFQAMGDPFPAFEVPQDLPVVSKERVSFSRDKAVTLKPGIYNGGISSTNKEMQMLLTPGTYIMQGGDFYVLGGQIQAEGVTMVFLPGGGKEAGAFTTLFGTKLQLSAPTSGPLQGFALLSAAKGTNKIRMQDTQALINGTIYGPQAEMSVTSKNSNVQVTRIAVSSLSATLGANVVVTGADMPADK